MANCPECNSKNIRMQVPGFARNELLCNSCGHVFHRMAPGIKYFGAITIGLPLIFDGLDGELGDGIDTNDCE